MKFDVLLPSALFLITVAIFFLFTKYERKIRFLFGGKELRPRDAVLLVAAMGIMVTILVFIPQLVIKVFFLCIYSLVLFLFTYLVVPKWYLAVLTPALFVALYLSHFWNIFLLNLFAIVFAIFISIYLGSLFTWKTTTVFMALLTLMDVVQVLLTGFMVESSRKMLALQLPMMIIIPTFPSKLPYYLALGLGDIFLFGLLIIQSTRKYGKKFGLASIIAIATIFLLLETILLNFTIRYFPATVLVTCGWLTALGAKHLYRSGLFKAVKTE